MSIREDLTTLEEVLANSTEITAFCQSKYGRKQTIFVGMNMQNPPNKDSAPSITIVGVKTNKVGRVAKYSFGIGIIVERATITEKNTPVKAITMEGFIEAEELREIVEDSVIDSHKFLKPSIDSETIQNEIFPIFTTMTTIIVEEVISSTGD